MKSKKEMKLLRDTLEERIDISNEDFSSGILCGAIDALDWAMGETNAATNQLNALVDMRMIKQKIKKRVVYKDYFAV